MRRSSEIVLMNLSKMAGGPGDLEHGKQIIFQMHNVEWMNAKTAMRQVDLAEKQYNFMTKPLMKGIVMPPFINTPTDLSAGEFATIMGAMESFSRMQGGGTGAMGDVANKAWNRLQEIRDAVTKKYTGASGTDYKKVDEELAALYSDPNSDYRMSADMTSQYFYAFNPIFNANGEVIPYHELPQAMKKVPYQSEGLFQGIRNRWNDRLFKWFGRGEEVPQPPSLGPGIGETPEVTGEEGFSAGQQYLGQ